MRSSLRSFETRWLLVAAVLLWLPPLGGWLKGSMALHMLVQISGFVLLGALLARRWLRVPAVASFAAVYRWPLLLTAVTTLAVWMIPRLLDLAVQSVWIDAAKAASLVVLGGAPFALAWSRLGPVLRALGHVEALATLWRLAWIYLESPSRLCVQYGLEDQFLLGRALVVIGAIYAGWLAARALGITGRPCAPATTLHSRSRAGDETASPRTP